MTIRNARFPNAGRTDLPEHERHISVESLAMLHSAVASARAQEAAGVPFARLDLSTLAPDEDETPPTR